MTEPEGFISRWSRLKHESDKKAKTVSTGLSAELNEGDAKSDNGDVTTAAPTGADEPAPQAFDPASLPPIESITSGSDIRSFLQSGVPAALTRAALRRAWATDPAIRDFIGIAENQWDFNDPTAIPGFGPMRATDDVPRLATQMLGRTDDALVRIAETPASTSHSVPAVAGAQCGESVAQPRQASDLVAKKPIDADVVGSAETQDKGDGAAERDRAARESSSRRHRRLHGSALPE